MNPAAIELAGQVEVAVEGDLAHLDVPVAAAEPVGPLVDLADEVQSEKFPMTIAPERREEFSPGLDNELLALIQATAEVEIATNGAVTK